jgi:hypothetical protein
VTVGLTLDPGLARKLLEGDIDVRQRCLCRGRDQERHA